MKIDLKPHLPMQPVDDPAQKRAEIKEAAQKFEAYLTTQLFKGISKTAEEVGNSPSLATSFFQENFAAHAADLSAERGELGLAKILEKAWTPANLLELQEARGALEKNDQKNDFFSKVPEIGDDDAYEDIDSEYEP
ncbi:hypothetical protein FRD01_15475 [Microvenator marinus]|jgi:Rod binding domain-containing protein|uniref:Uncharacterized protein n=1 Tax=Microvenator marinus TaxID=2600177 RepID=A0A5B8XUK4_9DELT|nr:hypothetical protein [Microvenator marinus]QED28608.1 hypothetical protein FRD01_15475 [Microvenator marinus]